jgi:hypothetical protein
MTYYFNPGSNNWLTRRHAANGSGAAKMAGKKCENERELTFQALYPFASSHFVQLRNGPEVNGKKKDYGGEYVYHKTFDYSGMNLVIN